MIEIALNLSGEKNSSFLPLSYHSGFMSLIKKSIEQEDPIAFSLPFESQKAVVKPYTFAVSFGDDVKSK